MNKKNNFILLFSISFLFIFSIILLPLSSFDLNQKIADLKELRQYNNDTETKINNKYDVEIHQDYVDKYLSNSGNYNYYFPLYYEENIILEGTVQINIESPDSSSYVTGDFEFQIGITNTFFIEEGYWYNEETEVTTYLRDNVLEIQNFYAIGFELYINSDSFQTSDGSQWDTNNNEEFFTMLGNSFYITINQDNTFDNKQQNHELDLYYETVDDGDGTTSYDIYLSTSVLMGSMTENLSITLFCHTDYNSYDINSNQSIYENIFQFNFTYDFDTSTLKFKNRKVYDNELSRINITYDNDYYYEYGTSINSINTLFGYNPDQVKKYYQLTSGRDTVLKVNFEYNTNYSTRWYFSSYTYYGYYTGGNITEQEFDIALYTTYKNSDWDFIIISIETIRVSLNLEILFSYQYSPGSSNETVRFHFYRDEFFIIFSNNGYFYEVEIDDLSTISELNDADNINYSFYIESNDSTVFSNIILTDGTLNQKNIQIYNNDLYTPLTRNFEILPFDSIYYDDTYSSALTINIISMIWLCISLTIFFLFATLVIIHYLKSNSKENKNNNQTEGGE